MSSRLERLFALIEHGETGYLRKTAAFQIGEIVKTHPNELAFLLEKLKPLIINSSWDTRIAASQAVEYLIKSLSSKSSISLDSLLGTADGYRNIIEFDLDAIIASGAKLLSADTEKYEIKEEPNANESFNTQRKLLNNQLGIDVAGAANLDTTHLFSDDDLLLNKTTSVTTNTEKINDILKKTFHSTYKPIPDTIKLNTDNKETAVLENFTNWLINNLYVPDWETRHGVATSLRELFKHGLCKIEKEVHSKDTEKLEDFLVKLLTIVSLDKFADYVGDEVIAPIRETCSQLIGILTKYLEFKQIESLCQLLNKFIENKANWEIRHSGILVLKYLIATMNTKVENDMIEIIIKTTFDNILLCISDLDDDVRQVATQTLVPISKHLSGFLSSQHCKQLLKVLIDVLLIVDDLSTSCTSIMELLCDLLEYEANLKSFLNLFDVNEFIKRLYLYIKHSNLNVKQMTLNTFNKIFQIMSRDCERDQLMGLNQNVLQNLFRLLYQQAIVETNLKCLESIESLWLTLCHFIEFNSLIQTCFPYITTWLLLLMYPAQQPIDAVYLIQISDDNDVANTMNNTTKKEYVGGSHLMYEDYKKRDEIIVQCRLYASRLLAVLFNRISNESDGYEKSAFGSDQRPIDSIINFLTSQITYKSGLNRICFALIMIEWGHLMIGDNQTGQVNHLKNKILELLNENTVYYDEISLLFTRMQKDCKVLSSLYKTELNFNDEILNLNVYTFEDGLNLVSFLKQNLNKFRSNEYDSVSNEIRQLYELIQKTSNEQDSLQLRSNSLLACASTSCKHLTDKMNPLIRPLMESIRLEGNEQLQKMSCKYLAILLRTCCTRQPNPNGKIFKNLLSSLCCDQTRTPIIANMLALAENEILHQDFKHFYELNRYFGILSIKSILNGDDSNVQRPSTPKLKRNFSEMNRTDQNDANDDIKAKIVIEKRGAEFTFFNLCQFYSNEIELIVPEVIQIPLNNLEFYKNACNVINYEEMIYKMDDMQIGKFQELVNSLQLLEHICTKNSNLNTKQIEMYMNKLDDFLALINNPLCALRNLAARAISSISKLDIRKCMNLILDKVIFHLDREDSVYLRQGACELIYQFLDKFNYDIIPYIVPLIVPVLKRMTDYDCYVRSTASLCFSTLIKLYPLKTDGTNGSNECFEMYIENENLKRLYMEQQDFLEQLCDNKKLKEYSLDPKLFVNKTISLRSYQQDGINWLAFLKRFNLHGILCDDMGLGKTLQSICILAGDYFEKFNRGKVHDFEQASIIVCPTTLTNHWYYEIKRFIHMDYLKPFIYGGNVNDREHLKREFSGNKKNYNIFIVSYETVRHDINFISSIQWNYAILDEGHLIKSTKTKISKAIKQINASHRLILTGTPIQNNVFELWCLFDFLIPGYLGTEKQFQSKYAKQIVPHANSLRQMSKEENNIGINETSLIALESLHKQVLPFLLRRTKEEVLKDLPPKIIQDYYCEMSALQVELYEDFAKQEKSKNNEQNENINILDFEENVSDYPLKTISKLNDHAFQALQYLRKVVNHPSLVLKPDHPKYRKILNELSAANVHLNDIKHSGKLLALKDLLHECGIGVENNDSIVNQHRVLVFCQLKSMIDLIENELLKKMDNVTFLRLDGTIAPADRYSVVHRFNSDVSIDVLLLTTQIGGLGLNLTGADTVIFVEHDWNPTKDLQAMDRAHRIGQKRVVNVYRLITKQTIEEKIMSLQKFKTGIANSIVNIENSSLSTMGTEQLLDLFSKDKETQSTNKATANDDKPISKGNYQVLIDSLTELWDEKQYESEYNLDLFIKSLNAD